jgi:hypothetical protein
VQFCERQTRNLAVVIGSAIDGLVVTDHQVAIERSVHVKFDRVRARG